MKMRSLPGGLLLVLIGLVAGWGIARLSAPQPGGEGPNQVLATVGGNKITREDAERMAPEKFLSLQRQRQELTEQSLQQAIRVKLVEVEAAAKGMGPDQLAKQEVYENVPEASEEEVASIYRQSGATTPRSQTDPQIRSMLKRRAQNKRYEEFLVELRARHQVEERLEPLRFEVRDDGFPAKGAADAPVTIVEFSDFQCPYCKELLGPIQQVLEAYGDKVRYVYRHFPLANIHPAAPKAAEASLCANEQGKFWEMHDVMFEDQGGLGLSQLKEKARTLNLDGPRFDECLDSGKYASEVAQDREEGRQVGVTGTPGLFINGRFLGGEKSAEGIAELILDELRRMGQPIEPRRLNPIRIAVEAEGFPARGPADAPVTIVEFADFQCPFCRQILGPLEQVIKTYGDRVRLVYRQFPIAAIHSEAQKAAEASLCASAQGKFWEMHDAMFADPRALGVPSLKKMARTLGMNPARFDTCLDKGEFASQVSLDLAAGRAVGVTGTPAMFINGRFLSGFQRFETLSAIVEDELSRVAK
jgi:protein-disulfide isomerase